MERFTIESGGEDMVVQIEGEFERWSLDRDVLEEQGVDAFSARYVDLKFVVAGSPEHVGEVLDVLSPRAVDMDVEILIDVGEEEEDCISVEFADGDPVKFRGAGDQEWKGVFVSLHEDPAYAYVNLGGQSNFKVTLEKLEHA